MMNSNPTPLVPRVRDAAEEAVQATIAAKRQVGRLANATRQRAAAEPMKAALIAAAIGAAASALVLSVVRSRRDTE